MKGWLDALVNYALDRGLIQEGDEIWAFNRLLEAMGLDEAQGEPVEAELPEIALRRAGLTAVKAENGETRYRMRERLLMQSGVSSDTYKLYCVAYRSR